jgi:folylpolyglutamate synthase/dihydropteroate synthase
MVSVERIDFGVVAVGWGDSRIEVALTLDGEHQLHNLQLAVALLVCAAEHDIVAELKPPEVRRGLETMRWPGRLSTHRVRGRRVLVDCAHNAEAARALASHLSDEPALYHLLFSCLEDKPVEAMADALRPAVGNVVVCPIDDERAMPADRLRSAFPEAQWAPSVMEAFELLPAPVVAAGSIRLVGELLGHSDADGAL